MSFSGVAICHLKRVSIVHAQFGVRKCTCPVGPMESSKLLYLLLNQGSHLGYQQLEEVVDECAPAEILVFTVILSPIRG